MDFEAWDDLVGDLYEAATTNSSEQLHRVLRSFESSIDSDACHLFATDPQGREVFNAWTGTFGDTTTFERYFRDYIHIDPRRSFMMNVPVGQVMQCSQQFDNRYVQSSEFYQDFLVPTGARYIAGAVLQRNDELHVGVAFNRAVGRADFTQNDKRLIARFVPHLHRAMRMVTEAQQVRIHHASQEEVLNQMELGLVGLDRDLRCLFLNEAAKSLLPKLPSLGWCGSRVMKNSQLGAAVSCVRERRQPISLRLTTLHAEFVVTVIGAPRESSDRWMPCISYASDRLLESYIQIQAIQPGKGITPSKLMQAFGLTKAEANLAVGLVNGLTVEQYADVNCVSVATVRTQLAKVLSKTGYGRQQDLLRHLASLR